MSDIKKNETLNRRSFIAQSLGVLAAPVLLGLLSKVAKADIHPSEEPNPPLAPRSRTLQQALSRHLGKPYPEIRSDELLSINKLLLPHIHIANFQDNDFEGLTNLESLEFFSLFHKFDESDGIAFQRNVFSPLANLKELIIDDELGTLPDDVFASLNSLRVLNLKFSEFTKLPQSIFELPQLEALHCLNASMPNEDLEKLKAVYGDRVKPSM